MAPSPLLSWAFVGVRTLLASFWPSMDENPTDSCAHWWVSCSSSVTEMWPGAAGGHPQPKHRRCAGHLLLTFGRREVLLCLQQAVVVLWWGGGPASITASFARAFWLSGLDARWIRGWSHRGRAGSPHALLCSRSFALAQASAGTATSFKIWPQTFITQC